MFTRKPLKLTETGQEIYQTVKKGFTDIDFAMLIAGSKNNIECGKIAIGCPSHITNFYLMEKIADAVKDYPNLEVNLDTAHECENLIEALKENKIDFAIVDRIPSEYIKDIEIKEIKRSDNIFIANKKIVIENIQDLTKYKYILTGEQRTTMLKLLEALKPFGVKLQAALRCGVTEQRINAARQGIGIAYVIKEAAKKEIENNELYEVKLPESLNLPKTSISLVYLKGHLTKVDKEFIKKYLK